MQLSDRARLVPILPDKLDEVWLLVTPFIDRALARSEGEYSLEGIYKAIKSHRMQLWCVYNDNGLVSAVVTAASGDLERLVILFCGGNKMSSWIHLIDEIIAWGKDIGCKRCEIHGRPGWEKILTRFGFKKSRIIMKLNL